MEPQLASIILLGIGGGLLGLCGVLRASWLQGRLWQWSPVALAGIAAALVAWDGEPLQWLVPLALIAVWMAVKFGDRMLRGLIFVTKLLQQPAVSWGAVLVASPMLAVLWSYCAYRSPEFWEPTDVGEFAPHIQKTEVKHAVVRTDAGRFLPVAAPAREATAEELQVLKRHKVVPDAICVETGGTEYNCHGWVFTGGRFWISSSEVGEILKDNGYRLVIEPQPGDVIVYKSGGGDVVHTGLVRSAGTGLVLIESKWGSSGRYIHTPENQEYSQFFQYFRSDRQGHLLHGIADIPRSSQKVSTPTAVVQ